MCPTVCCSPHSERLCVCYSHRVSFFLFVVLTVWWTLFLLFVLIKPAADLIKRWTVSGKWTSNWELAKAWRPNSSPATHARNFCLKVLIMIFNHIFQLKDEHLLRIPRTFWRFLWFNLFIKQRITDRITDICPDQQGWHISGASSQIYMNWFPQ